jgi:hypothetical protein
MYSWELTILFLTLEIRDLVLQKPPKTAQQFLLNTQSGQDLWGEKEDSVVLRLGLQIRCKLYLL